MRNVCCCVKGILIGRERNIYRHLIDIHAHRCMNMKRVFQEVDGKKRWCENTQGITIVYIILNINLKTCLYGYEELNKLRKKSLFQLVFT